MSKIKKDKTTERLIKLKIFSEDGTVGSLDNLEIIKLFFDTFINKNSKFIGIFNSDVKKIKNDILKSINIIMEAYSEIVIYKTRNESLELQIEKEKNLTILCKEKCWEIWKKHTSSKEAFDKWFEKKGGKISKQTNGFNEEHTAETFINKKQKKLNKNMEITFDVEEKNELKSLYTSYRNAQIEIDSLNNEIKLNSNNISKCLSEIDECDELITKSLKSFETKIWNSAIEKYDAELGKSKAELTSKLKK